MSKKNNESYYTLSSDGSFVIENYNRSKPFSNFFPGIAGVYGIPMWVFYVNRGQCLSSFGIESKDKSIVEFQPANKAYRLTGLQGFRTFIKIKSSGKQFFFEPFQDNSPVSDKVSQKMSMTAHDLTIEETNRAVGLAVKVHYFTLPEESFPALIRQVTIRNLLSRRQTIEVIDGLPAIIPFGITDWLNKNISRTIEAWVKVRNVKARVPFFNLNVEVADRPQVTHIKEGNFYFAFDSSARRPQLMTPIVEAAVVFGSSLDFVSPQRFLQSANFHVPGTQQTTNRTPCAMSFSKLSLSPKTEKTITSVIGYAHEEGELSRIVKKFMEKDFVNEKVVRNARLVSEVKSFTTTKSASPEFDLYSSQTFLDNVLRGGLPVSLKTGEGKAAFHVFSRKHGDLERDYNHFTLAPSYFSQGNGNYRDVNQNRRNDVFFNTDIKDTNIINFLNLIQADGYNPLIVKGSSFFIEEKHVDLVLKDCVVPRTDTTALKAKLLAGFQPGGLLTFIEQKNISLKVPAPEFLTRVLALCHKQEMAEHGEGFWTDHWTYNLDLIESYGAVYPEEIQSLLVAKKEFTFYLNSHYVVARDERYVLTPTGVRQYHSVKTAKDIKAHERGHKLRVQNGEGAVYQTTLLTKLLCLLANKIASLDPSGIGVEMEADKPNWFDSLNGLPGLLGSSINETLEVKRLAGFLFKQVRGLGADNKDFKVSIFEELAAFIEKLSELLSVENDALAYWLKSNDLKEGYRLRIRKGVSGQEKETSIRDVEKFLQRTIERVNRAAAAATGKDGLFATYFCHEVTEYTTLEKRHDEDTAYVYPTAFKRHDLPIFLEGFVHGLRVESNAEAARALYGKLRQSSLFDKKLKMYKVTSDLSKESEEVGRCRIFPAGWLENESIWLHMEYKYLLELLRAGLYEEFYTTFKDILVPFLDPAQYGRSTLENSSFIVSSAHEDTALHGQGFVARLSGSTAEFLHIWLLMNVGANPFTLNTKKELSLKFQPALAGWLFTKTKSELEYFDQKRGWKKTTLSVNSYAFNFLGSTLVVYHNPKRKNTFGPHGAAVKKIEVKTAAAKTSRALTGAAIGSSDAEAIRRGEVERIDIYLQ